MMSLFFLPQSIGQGYHQIHNKKSLRQTPQAFYINQFQ